MSSRRPTNRLNSDAAAVIGLGFGDEGKGSLVDFLVRHAGAGLVVRFNGGAQASHTVVTEDGRSHSFHQWGAGTFAGAHTFLSSHVLFNPLLAYWEAEELKKKGVRDPWALLAVDPECLVTTPFHVAMNRLLEGQRGEGRHGSCGLGIGETMEESLDSPATALRVKDLPSINLCARLQRHQHYHHGRLLDLTPAGTAAPHAEVFRDPLDDLVRVFQHVADRIEVTPRPAIDGPVIFEGAQGVLLDQEFGLPPYHTWSRTTAANALALASEWGIGMHVVAAVRTYMTRHGAGPFVEFAEPPPGISDPHNPENPWQGRLRAGPLDYPTLAAARFYAMPDSLAVTCCDQYGDAQPVEQIARALSLPLSLTSWGPTAADKRLHRPLDSRRPLW